MDFIDQIQAIAAKVPKLKDSIETEEATKNAFVMPFINALGYNVFDPTEVVPEFTADVGTKKGEKVDYAILKDGKPVILFECKWCGADLAGDHESQLYRYFGVTEARIGVLTNGVVYRFYSDLEEPNKMDKHPFLEFDLLDVRDNQVRELKKLTKSSFDLDKALSAASELKYNKAIRTLFAKQLEDPDDDFLRFFIANIYPGRITQSVKDQFTGIVTKALRQFIRDALNERLQSALNEGKETIEELPEEEAEEPEEADNGIETTVEEIQGFHIVQAAVSGVVDPERVVMRDTKSYCGILLDDNNRKAICRLHFNRAQLYIGLIGADKNEERVPIEKVTDIYKYTDRLQDTVRMHDAPKAPDGDA